MTRDKVERAIRFSPDHLKAGAEILGYFSVFFRSKHPDLDVNVSIIQKDNKISLIVEGPNGSKEVIEKALDEYTQVVSEKSEVDDLLDQDDEKIKLKHKLDLTRIELGHTRAMMDAHSKKNDNSDKDDVYKKKIDGLTNKINILNNELNKKRSQENEAGKYKDELELTNAALLAAKEELGSLRLGKGVDGAIDSISKSIADTDDAISRNIFGSRLFTTLSFLFYSASLGLVFRLIYIDHSQIQNGSSMYLYIFPAIATFLIGTALLRHDAKLRQHYLVVSKQKHSLEKATGLLEAARHLSEVENLNPLVSDTFSVLRSSLLSEEKENSPVNENDADLTKIYERIISSALKESKAK